MERYIGLDAHASSCTLAVVGPSGRHLGSHVVMAEVLYEEHDALSVLQAKAKRALLAEGTKIRVP